MDFYNFLYLKKHIVYDYDYNIALHPYAPVITEISRIYRINCTIYRGIVSLDNRLVSGEHLF